MSGIAMALSIPLIALSLVLSVVPVWFAAKVVGAGRTEFLRVAPALFIATALGGGMVRIAGGWGMLLMPVVFVMLFSRMLETSYMRAFFLCVLAMAFQAVVSRVSG